MRATKKLAAIALACAAFAAAAQTSAPPVLASTTPPLRMTLAEAYRHALQNDANLAAARTTLDARSERLPQAKAALLPSVTGQYSRYRNDLFSVSPGLFGGEVRSQRDYFSGSYSVTARQPVLRPQLWADYRQAKAQVEDARAQYDREVQNLAVRVATSYLQVLLSQEQITLISAQKKAYETQLDAARKAFAAGSGTRTDIDEAQAQLDLTIALELQAKQNLDYTRRTLQMLTSTPVVDVAGVDEKRLPLGDALSGGGLQSWVDRAIQTSPEVRSVQAQRDAAREEVEKARAGHLPTLDVIAQWNSSNSETVTSINQRYDNKSVGVQLNVPLFAGGYVNSQVRQALAALETSENQLEALKRDLSLRVEKEYRGVTEGVLQVRALEQAVRSGQTAATSASRSYQGGARTIVDVLNAEEKLVQARRDLAEARYNYLLSRIRLLALAGEADQAAIDDVNRWLAP